jgi:hypothetical protein
MNKPPPTQTHTNVHSIAFEICEHVTLYCKGDLVVVMKLGFGDEGIIHLVPK